MLHIHLKQNVCLILLWCVHVCANENDFISFVSIDLPNPMVEWNSDIGLMCPRLVRNRQDISSKQQRNACEHNFRQVNGQTLINDLHLSFRIEYYYFTHVLDSQTVVFAETLQSVGHTGLQYELSTHRNRKFSFWWYLQYFLYLQPLSTTTISLFFTHTASPGETCRGRLRTHGVHGRRWFSRHLNSSFFQFALHSLRKQTNTHTHMPLMYNIAFL